LSPPLSSRARSTAAESHSARPSSSKQTNTIASSLQCCCY
jgi:hypothetical protein